MQNKRVLVVDDESSIRTALFRCLDRQGYKVVTASTKAEALTLIQSGHQIDLALVDLRLSDGDGMDLLPELKKINSAAQIIVLTGFGTIELAVQSTHLGAFHFMTKPFNLDEMLSVCERALQQGKLVSENQTLKSALHTKYRFDNIIGQSDTIMKVLEIVERVATSDSTVLITGESGTGKELIAKAIHFNSDREDRPFIPVNCGAIPGELMESELFGHVKGAFTNAIRDRVGRFEMANGGTIFFDEIGDMSPSLQVKLLRVLQEQTFEPVGSTKTIQTNVRVLAATNIDLEKAVEDGRFREDLFYRLNVIPIKIPALRERRSDIPLLLKYFMEVYRRGQKSIQGFSNDAMNLLFNHNWPGNIRELENLVERLSILKGEGIVEPHDLPEKYQAKVESSTAALSAIDIPENGVDFNTAVDGYENALIMRALEKTGWNRNQAAILLRLNRTTLVEKIKKKGLRPPEESV